MASLIIENGTNQGYYYPLGHRTNVIGRSESVPIQILDDQVSRKHLQIRYDQASQSYVAIDMNSKHGVFVNNLKVTEEVVLKDEDRIQIGDTTLLFTCQDFPDAESALHYFKKAGQRRFTTLGDQ